MIKALLRLARAFTGLWSEIRRIRLLLEWVMVNGLTGRASIPSIGTIQFQIDSTHLPPTAAEIAEAEKDIIEHGEVDEEVVAMDRAVEIMKKRAKGEPIDENDPGRDWNLY